MTPRTAATRRRLDTRFVVTSERYKSPPVEAVLFDLDGVLVDSHRQIDAALTRWADSRSVDLTRWWHEAHSLTDPEFIALVAPDLDARLETRALRCIELELAESTQANRGARETYGRMPPEHRCIVTSGAHDIVLARLKAAGLPSPAVLVTAEDVDRGKPHPAPYALALDQLGVLPSAAIVVEDSPAGVLSALSIGAAVIGIAPNASAQQMLHAQGVVDTIPSLGSLNIDLAYTDDNGTEYSETDIRLGGDLRS